MKGRDIWIEKNLTWNERGIRQKLRQIAIEEEARGKRVWVGQGRIKIDGVLWIWDEVEERLREDRRRWGNGGERGGRQDKEGKKGLMESKDRRREVVGAQREEKMKG